ncbi:hypothetical protein FAI40_10460 (plasmid) [Acetobacteraceae bacterium]|nr:hypothetical protein FAI40_10355 [Acetobacteraceae bacterium]QCE35842.1 hypothetical protein FAI40_10460 [Acetobacteraceae bacterium]
MKHTEDDFKKFIIEKILLNLPNRCGSQKEIREALRASNFPFYDEDKVKSPTRHGEEKWEQLIRNIVSHKNTDPELTYNKDDHKIYLK